MLTVRASSDGLQPLGLSLGFRFESQPPEGLLVTVSSPLMDMRLLPISSLSCDLFLVLSS